MKYLIYMPILLIILSSCQSVKYIPIEKTRTEYKTREIIQRDSIFQKDSIYMFIKGDTIHKTEVKYKFRNITVHKTDTVFKTDSIPIPYPAEKQLTKWQSVKIELGGWAFGIIIIVGIGLSYQLIRR